MTEEEIIEHGKQMFEDCYRGVVPMPANVTNTGFIGQTMKMFHEAWGGIPQLSMREKRLVILGILLATARADTFAIHAESALRNGELSDEELRGVILMALPYVGFPSASACMLASEQVIASTQADARA